MTNFGLGRFHALTNMQTAIEALITVTCTILLTILINVMFVRDNLNEKKHLLKDDI